MHNSSVKFSSVSTSLSMHFSNQIFVSTVSCLLFFFLEMYENGNFFSVRSNDREISNPSDFATLQRN